MAAVLHQILSGNGSKIHATLNSNILNSAAPQQVFSKYGTYLLPQPFPEGSPTHPSYPTGHGTVAGACITLLKFFSMARSCSRPGAAHQRWSRYGSVHGRRHTDGQRRAEQAGAQRHLRTRNPGGHALARGLRRVDDAGRGDGTQLAAEPRQTYNEKFTIQLQRLDGSTATISNIV